MGAKNVVWLRETTKNAVWERDLGGGGEKSPKVVCFDLREQTPCCCNLPPRKLFNTESGSVNKGCNVDCE